jgi:hypothetical protein
MDERSDEAFKRFLGGQSKAAISRDMQVTRKTVQTWIAHEVWVRNEALKAVVLVNPRFREQKMKQLQK